MRRLFCSLLLLPLATLGQHDVKFVDTVTVSGFFYYFTTEPPWRVKEDFGVYADDHYFVSDSVLAGRRIGTFLLEHYGKRTDRDKFLTHLPRWGKWPFTQYDLSTRKSLYWLKWFEPFVVGKKTHGFGIPGVQAAVTRVTARWIQLLAEDEVVLHGFNNPPSLDEAYVRAVKKVNVYVPKRILAMDKHIKWWRRK